MNDLITQPKIDAVTIEIIDDAKKMKQVALETAKPIVSINDGFEAEIASRTQYHLRAIIKGIEESRKMAKAPALQIGKRIDCIAKDFIDEVKDEELRIAKLLGSFQKVERAKKDDADRIAKIEEQKILVKAAQDALADGEVTEELTQSAQHKIIALRQEASAKHEAVAGVKVRTTTKFEIVDEAQTLKARPDLFSLDNKKVRAALKITKIIPGIKVWDESKSY